MPRSRPRRASALSEHGGAPDMLPAGSEPRRPGVVRKSMDVLNGAVQSLRKQNTVELVETFTAEMTLVAEGLSEDQLALEQRVSELSAQQTILEEQQRAQKDASTQEIRELRARVEALEKKAEKRARQRGTVTQALRQATWIAAILGLAWVITALLRTFGG